MSVETALAITQRNTAAVEVNAAIAALLRADTTGEEIAPSIADALERVAAGAGLDASARAAMTRDQKAHVLAIIEGQLRSAAAFVEHPTAPPGWWFTDPKVIDGQGRMSMALVPIVQEIAPRLADLETRLAAPGARFLDVGTGAAWLATALTRAFPNLHVVGVDIHGPALELGRANAARSDGRVEIREQDVTTLDERDVYEAAFVPGPFLPKAIFGRALERIRGALRPGGWALVGVYTPGVAALSKELMELRIARAGGHTWAPDELTEALRAAGFEDAKWIEPTWPFPSTFAVGRRPT